MIRRQIEAKGVGRWPTPFCLSVMQAGGRTPGDERTDHVFRKGVVGDWRATFDTAKRAAVCELGSTVNRLLGYRD
jgi:hypothetical protein